MNVLKVLIEGYRDFFKNEYKANPGKYETLAKGQSPRIMIIGCSDSRVNPTQVLQVEPGDIFTVRNVANLVPPHEKEGEYHGTSAALEFAVEKLGVERILIMGHSQCGGIQACVQACRKEPPEADFINNWMSLARDAVQDVIDNNPDVDDKTLHSLTEKAAILSSLKNLETFPFIRRKIEDGSLKLFGAWFDIGSGALHLKHPDEDIFREVDVETVTPAYKSA